MFELWKDDMSRVRLDANSQVSSYIGSVWIDRTNWTDVAGVTYPYSIGTVGIPDGTVFVLFGTTDGQDISIEWVQQAAGYKILHLLGSGRAGITIYCFGARNVTGSNSGFQLLDTAGNITFDSQAKWMRIAGVINGPALGVQYPLPSGVPVVAAGLSFRGTWVRRNMLGSLPAWIALTQSIKVATTGVTIGQIARQRPQAANPPANSPQPPTGSIIFADVTRY